MAEACSMYTDEGIVTTGDAGSPDPVESSDPIVDDHSRYPIAPDEPPKNIVFLGDREVGKTTFIENYCDYMHDHYRCQTFRGGYLVFTQYLHFHRYHENRIPIRLLDLPAAATQQSRREQYPAQVHSIVLCFSIAEPRSFLHVTNLWIPEFRRHLSAETWMYLLGLKADRRKEMAIRNQNPVRAERASLVWKEHRTNDSDYMECSVHTDPAEARLIMEKFIHESFLHDAEPPLGTPS